MAKEFADKFYKSKAWKQCRESYISGVNGLCERCFENNRYTPGYILHHKEHITPLNIDDVSVTLRWDNLIFLCLECHNHVHYCKSRTLRDDLLFDELGNLVKK